MSKIVIFDSYEHGLFAVNPDYVVKIVAYDGVGRPNTRLCLTRGAGLSYDTVHVKGSMEEVVNRLNGGQ